MKDLIERLQQAGIDANPAYVENILGMSEQVFAWWFVGQLETLGGQVVQEWAQHVQSIDEDRPVNCRVGTAIIKQNLKLLLFLFEERAGKFEAIENV